MSNISGAAVEVAIIDRILVNVVKDEAVEIRHGRRLYEPDVHQRCPVEYFRLNLEHTDPDYKTNNRMWGSFNTRWTGSGLMNPIKGVGRYDVY